MNIEAALKEAMTIDGAIGVYLVPDRAKANLALARHDLKRIESDISP